MNQTLPRAELEKLGALLHEKRRRHAKALHKQRGHRDAAGVWRGGLLEFVRYFWPILEPGTKIVDGWALEAVCEHLEAVTFGEITRLLINVPPGFMKLCADSTPILTPHGYRTHGDLRPGDQVFGPDGKPAEVLRISAKAPADYEVKFSTHETIKCNGDHLWTVYDRWAKKWKTVETRELAGAGVEAGRSRFFIPSTHCLQFPEQELPLHPYFFGCWLGDGTSTKPYISHSIHDLQHIEKINSLGYRVEKQYRQDKTLHSVFTRQGVIEKIRALGVFGKKRIPEQYLLSSEEQRRELLAGLIDTDGTVDQARQRCMIYTCDPDLADDIQRLILSLGMRPYITLMDAPGYGEYSSDKIYHMIGFQPDKPIPTAIPRKQFSRFDFARRKRAIVSVTKSATPEMGHCITVDRQDGLYVVGRTNVVTHNSLLTDVFWPAWEWGPQGLPHLRYVTFSYSSSLTERDNAKFKDLITSPEYQAMYGSIVHPRKIGETKVSNWKHGWKLASSVGGVGTGERGDRAIIDDPHNVKESESKVVRQETIRWFRESLSSRLNNMETGAKVVIMQRVNEEDVSGEIIAEMDDWCHLLIPMEFVWSVDDDGEPFATDIGWIDPRWRKSMKDCEGELAWPERFPETVIPQMKKDAGPFAWASQYQQTPETRGGAIFEREWWQPWEPADGKFPVFSYIVASCDSAFGNKENADPSACVTLGIFENELGFNRVMVIEAWRRNLKFSGPVLLPRPGEKKMPFEERSRKSWGLVEWLADTCVRRKVDRLLIEDKASGISASQSLANSHPHAGWAVQLVPPKGDKWARAQSVQPSFSQEMVYIPWPLRQWGADLIDEMAIFPKGKYDDLTDAMTQGIKHLRDIGLLRNDSEVRQDQVEAMKPKGRPKKLYPGTAGRAA